MALSLPAGILPAQCSVFVVRKVKGVGFRIEALGSPHGCSKSGRAALLECLCNAIQCRDYSLTGLFSDGSIWCLEHLLPGLFSVGTI